MAKPIDIEDLIEPYPLKNRPSLTHSHPGVAIYWHYKRNCHFGPEDFSYGSNVKVWWKCPRHKEHEYQERIQSRVRAERKKSKVHGCPYCRGLLPCPTNWLANYPRLAKEWMTEKNGRSPKEIVAGSAVLSWWRCLDCGHQWKAPPSNRTNQESGCVKCNRGETTDLRDYPKILRQFDREKNKRINPYALPLTTAAWWKCPVAKDHRWQSTFHRRKGERCPFCLGYKPSSTNNLSLVPAIAKELHPARNGNLRAKDIPIGSNRRVWWKCREGPDHEWETGVYVRARKKKSSCPFCINQWVSITNCLATVAPNVARDWHPTKNRPLTPETVLAVANIMADWRCVECGHEWQTRVQNRVTLALTAQSSRTGTLNSRCGCCNAFAFFLNHA
jgi:hypothetical protein